MHAVHLAAGGARGPLHSPERQLADQLALQLRRTWLGLGFGLALALALALGLGLGLALLLRLTRPPGAVVRVDRQAEEAVERGAEVGRIGLRLRRGARDGRRAARARARWPSHRRHEAHGGDSREHRVRSRMEEGRKEGFTSR